MMPTTIEPHAPTTLAHLDLTPCGPVHPSPADWRDQTLYFLLPDRFSDGRERERPLFNPSHPNQFRHPDKAAWMAAGKVFQGGTLKGIQSKLDYLHNLGVTTLWIGPIWRQRAELETYHGYGIQNFLDVDPRCGTRQELRELVDAVHARGMTILLDIIYNHTGNNWFYRGFDGSAQETMPYRYSPPYGLHSWRSAGGQPAHDIQSEDDAVWPQEFQNPDWYTRAGMIGRWDPDVWENPIHAETEFRRGDFYELKDLNLSRPDVLSAIIKIYQYWIAVSDCDGFRIDTVKHISWEASRTFCGAIREYAESIGKNHFLLLGEVTGGAGMARNYLEIFGRNIDAVLDIGEPTTRLINMVRGSLSAPAFFEQFGGHDMLGGHRETGRYHVSILDDHDMVGRDKHRFAAQAAPDHKAVQTAHAAGVLLTTLGMPCIYYGTEQAFDGGIGYHDHYIEPGFAYEDRYVREAMFGAAFGAANTTGCHFFDQDHATFIRIAAIARIRRRDDLIGLACRRGRQYLREVSDGTRPFHTP
ncbi:MAG: alpha-amylase family glycosyl hydrolase, partial [Anaerolineae bacterium]